MRRLRASIQAGCGMALLTLLAGCGGGAEAKARKGTDAAAIVPVTVTPLRHMPVERTVEMVGTLKGWEEVTIGAKRTGRVLRVHHDMGDEVKPGETLVELEPEDAELAVRQAQKRLQAELAKLGLSDLPGKEFTTDSVPSVIQAQVALERAEREFNRQGALAQRQAGTLQDYQNAENDVKAARASLDAARITAISTLASAQAAKVAHDQAIHDREEMVIHAPNPFHLPEGSEGPVTYAITRRTVSEGQMIREGEAVFEMVIESPLRLWGNVPERFSREVQKGQKVRVHASARPDEEFEGTVTRINPRVDPTTRTFQVEVLVPNEKGGLRPGGFAKAQIIAQREDQAVVVPTEAIYSFAGVTEIFTVDGEAGKDLRSHPVPVRLGIQGDTWVEVEGDLPSQAEVVTSGQTQLAEGTRVTIREIGSTTKKTDDTESTSAKSSRETTVEATEPTPDEKP